MICPCGKQDVRTSGSLYVLVQYDKHGLDIVYAVCQHGVVVIDEKARLMAEHLSRKENVKVRNMWPGAEDNYGVAPREALDFG